MSATLRRPLFGELAAWAAAHRGWGLARLLHHSARIPAKVISALSQALRDKAARKTMLAQMRQLCVDQDDPTGLSALMPRSTPVTLVWGDRDAVLPLSHGVAFARALGLPLQRISYAGHLSPVDQPLWAASLIAHAVDKTEPIHIDLRGYNGVACADYIVRTEHVARNLEAGSEIVIHTSYACAGDDADHWASSVSKYALLSCKWIDNAWVLRVRLLGAPGERSVACDRAEAHPRHLPVEQ